MLVKDDFVRTTSIRIYNGLIRYYMHLPSPELLSDEDWAECLQDLHFIRNQEKEASEKT